MENILKREDADVYFDSASEKGFSDFLGKISEHDRWIEIPLSSVSLAPQGFADSSEGLVLTADGLTVPVFSQAYASLKRRAENEAKVLERFSPSDFAKALNQSWPYMKEQKAKALIRGGSLLALLSEKYAPIAQSGLYESFRRFLSESYEDVSFRGARYTHQMTSGTYLISDESLTEGYIKALEKEGFSVSSEIAFCVSLVTSDTGSGAVSVYPAITFGKSDSVQVSPPLSVIHKGDIDIADIEKDFPKLFALMKKSTDNLERLLEVRITYPSRIAAALSQDRRFSLPKRLIREVLPQLQMYESMGEEMSAHDFYFTLADILSSPRFKDLKPRRRLQIRENLAKVAYLSEEEFRSLEEEKITW